MACDRTDGGPPYNGKDWVKFVEDWGATPKKTKPYHPPANGMVERFNRNLKKVILAAYAEKKDPYEGVQKYVTAYRNTPHSTTGEKPSKLMFGRDVITKLPRLVAPSNTIRRHASPRRKQRQR